MLSFPPRSVLFATLAAAIVPTAASAASDLAATAWEQFQRLSGSALQELATAPGSVRPSGDDAVLELSFQAMFQPLGERGLEYSDQLRALEGRRVRVTGYMVREAQRTPGLFLLTPRPVRIEAGGSGEIADLPPTTVHVLVATERGDALVGYRPGLVTVTGVLELGFQPERDGRNSVVRVRVDVAVADELTSGA